MNRKPTALHRTTLWLTLALMLAAPLATLAPVTTQAQVSGCLQDALDFPLFVTHVGIKKLSGDPDSVVTAEGAAFVEAGDRVEFTLTVLNRINPACSALPKQDTSNVRARITYPLDATLTDVQMDGTCHGLATAGASCSNFKSPLTVKDGLDGEHRVRFVVGQQGDGFKRLAGAERILVVGLKPDLEIEDAKWVEPANENQRHTDYGGSGTSTFDVNVTNAGTYPVWNPNGAPVDDNGVPFFIGRSAFDASVSEGDNDEAPDLRDTANNPAREQQYQTARTTQAAPRCITDGAGAPQRMTSSQWSGSFVCSYVRGAPLLTPILFEVTRPGSSSVVLRGDSDVLANPESLYAEDKDVSILYPGHQPAPNGDTFAVVNVQVVLLNDQGDVIDSHRLDRAGDYDITWTIDRNVAGKSFAPEESETNNAFTNGTDILGVDLKLQNPQVVVEGLGGVAGCGVSPDPEAANGPCPSGSKIIINAAYINAGDPEVDGVSSVTNREWKAAVWMRQGGTGDFTIAQDENGEPTIITFDRVRRTDEGAVKLWAAGVKVPSATDGGVHEVQLRLDHTGNYAGDSGPPPKAFGKVAERVENFACPNTAAEADNIFCVTLYFDDTTLPVISDLKINNETVGDDPPVFFEGDEIEFTATVTDNSLHTVEARFTDPDGNVTNVTMDLDPDEANRYRASVPFIGTLGDHIFDVWANDTFGHENITDEGFEFRVAEWPKDITVRNLTVNGEGDFLTNAPEYNGTASAPDNRFHIEADIANDGREDPFDPAGKNVTLFYPNGTVNATLPMDFIIVCDLVNPVTGGSGGTGRGNQCDADEGEVTTNTQPPMRVENKRPRWFVDNENCTSGTFQSDHCSLWKKHRLGWVGEFDLNVTVTDPYNRSRSKGKVVEILDVDGPPELTGAVLSPTSANPGQTITARAEASDGLRVEKVVLRVTKPDNTVDELPLKITQVDDEETLAGTYTGTFDTGAFMDLDQAGRYKTDIVAIDFANKETVAAVGDNGNFRLNDTERPQLRQFFTVPPEAQEENGPVTWEVDVVDATAVKPPKLTVTRPASGTETFELVFNEDTGRWNFTLIADPADVGTWSYTLDVEDYAGNLVSATGTVRIETNLPPQALNWKPAVVGPDGKAYGAARPTIQVDLVDFGSGVQQESIKMTVDGKEVAPQLSPIQNGFRLSYTVPSSSAFEDGDVVTVKVEGADNSEPDPLVAKSLTHQFIVDATPPEATFDAQPSLVRSGQRVIGLITDINVTATDAGSGPGETSVTVQHLAGTTPTAQESFTFAGKKSFRLDELDQAFQGHGSYRILITPEDAVRNTGNQIQHQVLYDKSPPKVRVFAQPGQPREVVFANITDDSAVESALVRYKADGGTEATLDLEHKDGAWTGTIPSFPKNTTVEFTVEAKDFFGNVGSSPKDTFRAGDAVPTITLTSPTEGEVISGTHQVTWTASDLETPAGQLKVSLYYQRLDEGFRPIADAQNLNNVGRHSLDTTVLPNGEVTLQAIVFDGTNFGDSQIKVRVQNLNQIFSDPKIEGARLLDGVNVVRPGQEAVFSVQLNGMASKVWANITDQAGELVLSVPLDATGNGAWTGSFTAPADEGDYEVTLAALTGDGPVQNTNAYAFRVQSADGNGKSFVSEWVILSVLFAGALAVGIVGLAQRWK